MSYSRTRPILVTISKPALLYITIIYISNTLNACTASAIILGFF